MSRKHYKEIAAVIKLAAVHVPMDRLHELHFLAQQLADFFHADNPRFSSAKFIEACGFTP